MLTKDTYQQHVDTLIKELVELYERINYPTLAKQFRDQCYNIINTTAANQSSMMLDVKRGQQTEIEAITGYLLNHANRVRLSMTEHQKLYHRLLNS